MRRWWYLELQDTPDKVANLQTALDDTKRLLSQVEAAHQKEIDATKRLLTYLEVLLVNMGHQWTADFQDSQQVVSLQSTMDEATKQLSEEKEALKMAQ